MIIDNKLEFIFIHIPKTGGSSVNRFFDNINTSKIHLDETQHYTSRKIKNLNEINWKKYFKFAFVRNPFDRIVSYYEYQFKNKMSFCEFVKFSKDLQYNYLFDNKTNKCLVDFVGKFENLNEDFKKICKIIKINNQKNLPHINKTFHKKYTEYYNSELIKIVEHNYIKDIIAFNYKFGE